MTVSLTEEQVVYVKQELQGKGYYSREFSRLPNDMSCGSRELLLALAWLLCSERVIDKFMENCASPIEEDDYTPDVRRVNNETKILLQFNLIITCLTILQFSI